MTVQKLIKEAERMIDRRNKEIEQIEKVIEKVEKESSINLQCKLLGDHSRLSFHYWDGEPNWVHIDSKKLNSIYGVKFNKKTAIRLRNWLNLFISGAKN